MHNVIIVTEPKHIWYRKNVHVQRVKDLTKDVNLKLFSDIMIGFSQLENQIC